MARITGVDNNIFKKIRKGILDKGPLSSHAVLGEVIADIKQYAYEDEHGEYYVSISQLENILGNYFA